MCYEQTNLPAMAASQTESDNVAALSDAEGGRIGMLLARILDRIWPTQESARASRRLIFSSLSVYRTTSRTASESFLLATVDSVASISRSNRASVRIWLAVAACSVELADGTVGPGGCFRVSEIGSELVKNVLGPAPQGCAISQ